MMGETHLYGFSAFLVDMATEVRRQVLAAGYTVERSCVPTTWNMGAVAEHFGFRFRPQAVRVAVRSTISEHSVGVAGTGLATLKDWDGHLVGVLDEEWIIDASADMFHRPAKGLNVTGPIVVPLAPVINPPRGGIAVFLLPDNTTTVSYGPFNATDYRRSPAWGPTFDNRRISAEAIYALRDTDSTEEGQP